MIELDSGTWANLSHIYGPADDIPNLIRAAEALPECGDGAEPYHSLWSALWHQGNGDVRDASYAAVPHLVRIILSRNVRPGTFALLGLVSAIEAARQSGEGADLPDALLAAYENAIGALRLGFGRLIHTDAGFSDAIALCHAVATLANHVPMAQAILELEYDGMIDALNARLFEDEVAEWRKQQSANR